MKRCYEFNIRDDWQKGHPNYMTRTFHPVGHGAFYTERFNDEDGKCVFTAVYDCGASSSNRIEKAIKAAFKNTEEIDLLFISHLHKDHINGVMQLMEQCNVKRIVLPALEDEVVIEALLYNYTHQAEEFDNDANKFIEKLLIGNFGSTKITQVGNFRNNDNTPYSAVDSESVGDSLTSGKAIEVKRLNWRYYPLNLSSSNSVSIINKIAEVAKVFPSTFYLYGRLDYKEIRDVVEGIGISECAKIYKEVFGCSHNNYSMPLVSMATVCLSSKCKRWCRKEGNTPTRCLTNCLYTGDFEATKKFDALKEIFKKFDVEVDYAKIGILQVPHHGSKHNINTDMYEDGKVCIISAGRTSKHHPDMSVLQNIQYHKSVPIIVTEIDKSIQRYYVSYAD